MNPDEINRQAAYAAMERDADNKLLQFEADLQDVPSSPIFHDREHDGENNGPHQGTTASTQQKKPPVHPRELIYKDAPFRILGHDKGTGYYLPQRGRQITEMAHAALNKSSLLRLAPLDWWESKYKGEKGPANWTRAQDDLMELVCSKPVFSNDKIRGRGAWLDRDRVVYHAGSELYVDGHAVGLDWADTDFVYEAKADMPLFENAKPAQPKQAAKLIEICDLLPLKNKLLARAFAGWVALAPICGVLDWRSNVWLAGGAGAGKSWVINNIVYKLLDPCHIGQAGTATEAACRQELGTDARPVVIDEAESKDKRSRDRMQQIMDTARDSSSGSGRITRGQPNGAVQVFHIRSMWLFASIGVAATDRADISRITVVELINDGDKVRFEKLQKLVAETCADPDWCAAIRARMIKLAPTVRHNAKVFRDVLGLILGDARAGDQLGTLLAGAYTLTTSKKATPEIVRAWADQFDWSDFRPGIDDRDEMATWSHLLASHIRDDSAVPAQVMTVGECIQQVDTLRAEGHALDAEKAERLLKRHGLILQSGDDYNYLIVASRHPSLYQLFKDTPWAGKWTDQLARMEGAEKLGPTRFLGARSRAVAVPIVDR